MKINQAVSSTLLVAITEAIQDGQHLQYGLIDFPKGWEEKTLVALSDEFRSALNKSLDGSSFEAFVKESLEFIRLESGVPSPKTPIRLTELTCFKDALSTARIIVANLERVPAQYRLITRISKELGERITCSGVDVKLSDRLRVLSFDMIPKSFVLKHTNSRINAYLNRYHSDKIEEQFQDNALYLEFRTTGYLARRRSSRAISEFYDEIRAFYGACIANGIFYEHGGWSEEITPLLIGNSIHNGVESFAYVERCDEDVVACAALETSMKTDRQLKNGNSLEEVLTPIKAVFNSDNHVKLKTASTWALRAHLSRRGLDKILESAITIEVLMGDRETSDRIGLTKLIANRCAYALGKSNKEREDLIKFFIEFYKVRSEVVHSGRTVLNHDERKIVDEGLELSIRVLKHEIELSSDTPTVVRA
ncbi:HEPN domain-containing protein [Sphingomonas sp. BK069]|uniref:HEPN domain-containing protein n=1 Tax=Sphingomonas sp. BK069 TaxID=2586979 RepID=UPI001622A6D7|nr:HEPN domain-containing protein [Sphingomonas sp. BK069]MBB3347801.1 hypothetical protein [Sphingomonas sp. BK069]